MYFDRDGGQELEMVIWRYRDGVLELWRWLWLARSRAVGWIGCGGWVVVVREREIVVQL